MKIDLYAIRPGDKVELTFSDDSRGWYEVFGKVDLDFIIGVAGHPRRTYLYCGITGEFEELMQEDHMNLKGVLRGSRITGHKAMGVLAEN